MAGKSWTNAENNAIVADYFAMLACDLAGKHYNKSEHNRDLQSQIGRSKGAIEYKYQNISAVLQKVGETWILGYKPASNFQDSLVQVVLSHLERHRPLLEAMDAKYKLSESGIGNSLVLEPPPLLRSSIEPIQNYELEGMARRFNAAERDARNRALGKAGERFVFMHEIARLEQAGLYDLARDVRWVAADEGDGLGFDISSFTHDGKARLIEVKTTNGWSRTPFYISRNEINISEQNRDTWCLLRVWDFVRNPRAFELRPPLDSTVRLQPSSYEARFN